MFFLYKILKHLQIKEHVLQTVIICINYSV